MNRKSFDQNINPHQTENAELLNDLYRLNKSGLINDEEFLVLRKILSARHVKPETYRHFERLFLEKKPRVADFADPGEDV